MNLAQCIPAEWAQQACRERHEQVLARALAPAMGRVTVADGVRHGGADAAPVPAAVVVPPTERLAEAKALRDARAARAAAAPAASAPREFRVRAAADMRRGPRAWTKARVEHTQGGRILSDLAAFPDDVWSRGQIAARLQIGSTSAGIALKNLKRLGYAQSQGNTVASRWKITQAGLAALAKARGG